MVTMDPYFPSMMAVRSLRNPSEPTTHEPQRFRQVEKKTWLSYELAQEDAVRQAVKLNVLADAHSSNGGDDLPFTSFQDSSTHRLRIRLRDRGRSFDVLVFERLKEKE